MEALRIATEIGAWIVVCYALPTIILLQADRGEVERAIELYALGSRYPNLAHSFWFDQAVGQHMPALTATLPPDVVAAAQERGKQRDLWVTVEELLTEFTEPQVA